MLCDAEMDPMSDMNPGIILICLGLNPNIRIVLCQ